MYPFLNNVWSHFIKIIEVFYDKLMNQKYVATSNFRIFWPNYDITLINIWSFGYRIFNFPYNNSDFFIYLRGMR